MPKGRPRKASGDGGGGGATVSTTSGGGNSGGIGAADGGTKRRRGGSGGGGLRVLTTQWTIDLCEQFLGGDTSQADQIQGFLQRRLKAHMESAQKQRELQTAGA